MKYRNRVEEEYVKMERERVKIWTGGIPSRERERERERGALKSWISKSFDPYIFICKNLICRQGSKKAVSGIKAIFASKFRPSPWPWISK